MAFTCNDHTHLCAIPPWAAWVESERFRKTPFGLSFRPDIVILGADELEIPWFRLRPPPPEATQAVLAARTYPEGHWFRDSDGFHAEVDAYVEDGAASFGMIYHSEVAPGSVNIGTILFASATNLTCRWADWLNKGESLWKSVNIHPGGHLQLDGTAAAGTHQHVAGDGRAQGTQRGCPSVFQRTGP